MNMLSAFQNSINQVRICKFKGNERRFDFVNAACNETINPKLLEFIFQILTHLYTPYKWVRTPKGWGVLARVFFFLQVYAFASVATIPRGEGV
jgi:hypothetical protein